jgi:hypothetical protein
MRYCRRFLAGIPHWKAGHPCVTHPSATPSPSEEGEDVRLACVRHAASVYPEPGSNSPSKEVSTLLAWSRDNAQWLSCDPGQAAVQCCPYLAVRRCIASCLPPLARRTGTKQEIDRNCLLVRGARRVVGAFFALTKKQLLFCFPLFSC